MGYHGRASSIVVSGTCVRRPWGQVLPPAQPEAAAAALAAAPAFQPSAALDYELEMVRGPWCTGVMGTLPCKRG